jgi:hypothetical protein
MLTEKLIASWAKAYGMEHHYEIINQLVLAISLQAELTALKAQQEPCEMIRSAVDYAHESQDYRRAIIIIERLLEGKSYEQIMAEDNALMEGCGNHD